jgi:hypothetical protein
VPLQQSLLLAQVAPPEMQQLPSTQIWLLPVQLAPVPHMVDMPGTHVAPLFM